MYIDEPWGPVDTDQIPITMVENGACACGKLKVYRCEETGHTVASLTSSKFVKEVFDDLAQRS